MIDCILKDLGLAVLAMLIYAVAQVYQRIKEEGFSLKKFFFDNYRFWLAGVSLSALLAVASNVVPVVHSILALVLNVDGEDGLGFVLLGFALASGLDLTNVIKKRLNSKLG